ncbi:hypothetical protein NL533_31565, partial [Klebsiella pneumoniae]|nr:hypothetical protein [Klebsiella pneumoniae]
ILFLDEPTSVRLGNSQTDDKYKGLDAAGADKVMTAIQKVALSGTAVICTIHQPSQRIFFR